MALIAHLSVNDNQIGWVAATRTAPGRSGGLPEDDEVHTYVVEAVINAQFMRGEVTHRYGDGAAALMAKAMAVVSV